MPWPASSLRRVAFRLLENGREDVARVRFVPLRALDVQNRGLQHATECERLLGLPLFSAALALDRFVEVNARARGAAPADPRRRPREYARRRARGERVEQMLECQIGMPSRHRFAEREW